MSSRCPSCGSEMEFSERAVVLRAGTCPSCAKEFAFVEGATMTGHLPAEEAGGGAKIVGAPIVVAEDAPECAECGAPVAFQVGARGAVRSVCSDCEAVVEYVPATAVRESMGGEDRPRGRRPMPAEGGPRSRPCRRCGAPLRFSTAEDGSRVGECDSCGNRFTLPPREEGYGDRPRRGPRDFGRSSYRPRDRKTPYYSNRRPPGRGSYTRRRDADAEDDPRRRRRRRTDDSD